MANRYVELEVSPALRRLYGPTAARRRTQMLVQAIEHWGEFTTAQQRIYAPRGETGRLFAAIHQTHPRTYLPGGPGGGGSYEVSSGVRRGIAPHAENVLFGTAFGSLPPGGIPAGGHVLTPGRIYPKSARFAKLYDPDTGRSRHGDPFIEAQHAPALMIQKRGEVSYRAWVTGQQPNNFVYEAFVNTMIYARGQIGSLARGMFRPR